MLELADISVSISGRAILNRVSLAVAPGECVAIIGANGAGKSTLLKVLSGQLRPDGGVARLDGRDIGGMGAAALALRRAVVAQSVDLSFPFTASEVVHFGAEAGGASGQRGGHIAAAALALVDMTDRAGQLLPSLSGGEAQRVHLARAIAQIEGARQTASLRGESGSHFLLLDEPTASLDLRHQVETLTLARGLAKQGIGVVVVLHDLNLAALTADRIVALADGRVVAAGPVGTVIHDALIAQVYGIALPVGRTPPHLPFVLPQTATIDEGRRR